MKNRVVEVASVKQPIKRSPGFAKKELSTFKLDIMALCGFGCRYCSSNAGNYLRINRSKFAHETEKQLGVRLLPAVDPTLTFEWPDIVPRLETQLATRRSSWGEGETLVFSMLTDGFSPRLVQSGLTRRVLELLVERTSFRVRILTKNAVVGAKEWVAFLAQNRNRFVVGLSIGTLDDRWATQIEVGTSPPSARLRALARLQEAGVPTYGMLCPVFPDVLEASQLEKLVDAVAPQRVEHLWAEPFNDRVNWQIVRGGYERGTPGWEWFTDTYEHGNKEVWSAYATELYTRLRTKAEREGWVSKLRYLLYELDISKVDASRFQGLSGVLLQSKPGDQGLSKNPSIAALQRTLPPC